MAPRRARDRLPRTSSYPPPGPPATLAPPGVAGALALVLLLLGGGVAVGCGKRGRGGSEDGGGSGGRASGPDLSTPEAVLVGVADTLARGDLEGLDARLTPEARAAVRRDLEAFHAALRDPAVGPRYAARLPAPRDDAEAETYRKAILEGDPAGLFLLLMRASPRPPPGPAASASSAPADAGPRAPMSPPVPPDAAAASRLERDLPAGDGTRRRVVLVREGGLWRVDRLQL